MARLAGGLAFVTGCGTGCSADAGTSSRVARGAGSLALILLTVAAVLPVCMGDAFAVEKPKPLLAFAARIAGDETRTRVIIDFDGKPSFQVHYVGSPERVIIDLSATAFGFPAKDLSARGLFRQITYGTMGESSARIVLTATKPVKLAAADVRPAASGGGYRLVLDAEPTSRDDFAKLLKGQDWSEEKDTTPNVMGMVEKDHVFTVAVDAGHGGIDNGATSAVTNTHEKVITLAVAKLLAEKLNKISGIKAFLTRSDDTFLTLSERVNVAREHRADLFISLHADTLSQRDKDIRGATVYTLSDKASDRLAEQAAARENLSDELAGFSIKNGPPEVADILLDLTRRETQAFSVALADNVVSSFTGKVTLINNPHRQANFQVLRAPDIPSILIELGFLSNADDSKLLMEESWRQTVTDRIADAVARYHTRGMANGG